MGFYARRKRGPSAIAAIYFLLCVAASRKYRDTRPLTLTTGVKKLWSIFSHDTNNDSTSLSKCTTEVALPARLLAVDGGGTQVKVLLMPDDWPSDRAVRMIAELSQCETTEEILKRMLREKTLLLPAYGEKPFLPVTGGLGDRLIRERAFKGIVAKVPEFDAIAEGTIAERLNQGFVTYVPRGNLDLPRLFNVSFDAHGVGKLHDEHGVVKLLDGGKNESSAPEVTRAIVVDTTNDKIYYAAWDEHGDLLESKQLSQLQMGPDLFKKSFEQLYKRYVNSFGGRFYKKVSGINPEPEKMVFTEAARAVRERLPLGEQEAVLRELEAKFTNGSERIPENRSMEPIREKLQKIYDNYDQKGLVSKAHKLIKEIYPNGIGKLGPYATACFMAHGSRCSSGYDGLRHYAMGFMEMIVVNTIQLAELWKGYLGLEKVFYVGKLVQRTDEYGEISREFFESRMSKEILEEKVVLDDLQTYGAQRPIQKVRQFLKESQKKSHAKPRESSRYEKAQGGQAIDSYTIASLGTGVPILKVLQNKYQKPAVPVGGSAVGGGTFWGLMKAAYPDENDFAAVVQAAITGEKNNSAPKDKQRLGADAQSKVTRVAWNIAEVVSLTTLSPRANNMIPGTNLDAGDPKVIKEKMGAVVFVGGFLKTNPRAEGVITHICASFGIKSMFEFEGEVVTHGHRSNQQFVVGRRLRGFIGAFGAWRLRPNGDAPLTFMRMPDDIVG